MLNAAIIGLGWWGKRLIETLADFAHVPADEIARETYFLQSSLKRAKVGA